MANQIGYFEDKQGNKYIIPNQSPVIIGRNNVDCDVVFDDPSVSRKHATITRTDEGVVWIADMNSSNGTKVDGVKIGTRAATLVSDAEVRFGNYEVKYREGE